jgi:hypothetical protein
MVTSLSSPGVEVVEIDNTLVVPSVSTTEGALAGVFRWGPVDERGLVQSEKQLVELYGKPNNNNFETFFTASSFLAYGNQLYISRAANTVGSSPSVTCNVETSNTTVTLSTGDTAELEVGMRVVATSSAISNAATIASVVNSTAFTITNAAHVLANTTETVIQFMSNTAFNALANSGAVANLTSAIVKNETDFSTKDGTFDTDINFVARYPGELGNSLRVSVCGNSVGYSSTINLASYGEKVYMSVNTGSNTANVTILGAANADNSANATAIKALLNVTDLLEAGNTVLGTQFLKITSLSNTVTFGTTSNTQNITTVSGNTSVTLENTDVLAVGMEIRTAENTAIQGLRIDSITNSTVAVLSSAPTVNLTTNAATFDARAEFQISFEDQFTLAENYVYTTANTSRQTFDRHWEFYNFIDNSPGQSAHHQAFGNSSINNDEIHIVVTDNDGVITGVPGTVLETYESVSIGTDAKTVDGASNFWKTQINNKSRFIYAVNDISGFTSDTSARLESPTLDVVVQNFNYGNDGKSETDETIGTITQAYSLFGDKEEIDISLIMQGKAKSTVLANWLFDNIASKRKDCVVFVSPQRGDVVNNRYQERAAVKTFRNGLRSGLTVGSYGFIDTGYKYMYDRYNDVYRWVPMNGDTAGLCVRTDRVAAPWHSIMGLNRGQIKNVVKLAWNPSQAERDDIYKSDINPIVTFPGQGTVLFGDKTLLGKPSAFDRINVRRLFIVLEKAIERAAKYVIGELNDDFTRTQFRNLVVPYLREIKGNRGITDFYVVCDETNNPGSVVDRNEFIADIYIKPARSINFVKLNFIAVGTDVSFNEVLIRG